MKTLVSCRICGRLTENKFFCTAACRSKFEEGSIASPTPEEIQSLCDEIQRSWSDEEKYKRRVVKDPPPVTVQAYSSTARNLERTYAPADA